MIKFIRNLDRWSSDRSKLQKRRRSDQSSVEVLAAKDDIAEAIEAGYSMATIWEYLHEVGRISVGYDVFRRRVNSLIRPSMTKKEPRRKDQPGSPVKKPHSISGFVFDPDSRGKEKKLL